MRAAGWLIVLLLLLVPGAGAYGERVAITDAALPAGVVAERPFYINVSLENKQPAAANVLVFTVLYTGQGATPCDGARANHTLSKFENSVQLAAGARTTVDGAAEHWAHVVNGSRLGADGTYEACVWVRLGQCPPDQPVSACLLDFRSVSLRVRVANAAPKPILLLPSGDVRVGAEVQFRSASTDGDADPLTARWDFGDGATAQGDEARHRFARAGAYNVKLNVSDGYESVEASTRVTVVGADQAAPTPAPPMAFVAFALLIAARAHAWRARR